MMNFRAICVIAILQLIILTVAASSAEFPQQKVLNKKMEVNVQENPVFHRKPLYYYALFAAGMSHGGKGLSLGELYEKERALRTKIDQNKNKVDGLKRKRGIQKRDDIHEVNMIEAKKLKAREQLHETNFVDTQRETAIKFEINHDQMWKAYYAKREKHNKKRLNTAFKGERPGIKKLITNDKLRITFYHKASLQQWKMLQDLKARQKFVVDKLEYQIEKENNAKAEATLKGSGKVDIITHKIKEVEVRDKPMKVALKTDLHLGGLLKKRMGLEQKELNATKSAVQDHIRKEGKTLKPKITKSNQNATTKNRQAKPDLEHAQVKDKAKRVKHLAEDK